MKTNPPPPASKPVSTPKTSPKNLRPLPFDHIEKHKLDFFASCPPGLEPLLEKEIQQLQVKSTKLAQGGVEFEAYNEKALELIFTSRIASRVFKKYYSFKIGKINDLYRRSRDIKWKAIFDVQSSFKIITTTSKKTHFHLFADFSNTLYVSQIVKDGIVDRFKSDLGVRPTVDTEHPKVTIHCHLTYPKEEGSEIIEVSILLDLCGDPLSDRGYRPLARGAVAPLRENLAAGLVLLTEWKPYSEQFIDLMCGSGTLLMEAYMWAKSLPPSAFRLDLYQKTHDEIWAFQNLEWFKKDAYLIDNFNILMKKYWELSSPIFEADTTTSLVKANNSKKIRLLGIDIDDQSVHFTEKIRQLLRAEKSIEVKKMDCLKYTPERGPKLVLVNPPYGERLNAGETEYLENLYFSLGEKWKHDYDETRAFVFSSNFSLLKRISLRPDKKWILFNGPLEARLAHYPVRKL